VSGSTSHRAALAFGPALSALALLAAPAVAQKYYDDEIVVTPPVYSEGTYSRGSGPNERVSAQVIVSTRDLNLRSDYDVAILQERISDGARLACEQAEEQIRSTGGNPGVDQPAQCYRDTRLNALREARAMVDYARG
jgi:UrcA family protein